MDCRTARLLLDYHRPRAAELPAEDAAELERHLASCPDCDGLCRAGQRMDDHVGRALRAVPVPDKLRDRLLGRLKTERRRVLRRKLLWSGGVAATAAAAVVAALFVVWQLTPHKPPQLDFQTVLAEQFTNYDSPSAEKVEQWFQEKRHVTMVAPTQFQYIYLAERDLGDFQGKRVPKLVFVRDTPAGVTRAHVYVLTRDQFDFDSLLALDERVSFGLRIKVLKSDSPDVKYLVIYEGENLKPLFIANDEA
jgi:hypothetical protein